ncbi:sensor histidine kinase [Marilutibacter alkalisoli]|uniref:Signlal transduction histidine kinase, LytS n=1 Tax=Marilutibacter alkalisoli TaxID=2591633 RepID=A0A514BQ54_9GAMM|nr:histidine kinase [Lysobacter alkalisoli]QDH69497.1 signlal transduction histidine kinase, LytS [Lysobacter alkalisoli]
MAARLLLLCALVLVWWTLNGLVWTGQVMGMAESTGQTLPLGPVLRMELASAWLWAPLTLGLFWWVRRWPIEPGRILRALALQWLAVALVIVLRALAVLAFNDAIGWYPELPPFTDILGKSVLNNLLMSWLIIGVAHAWFYAGRARRREREAAGLESQLAQARLQALTAQIHPHFLFNALNSIAETVHRDPEAADRMLVDLGAMLRYSLDGSRRKQVPLREELVALDHYLGIEKARLGERLQVEWTIDSDLLDADVPPLLLQPLVENAVRHAIAARTTPGTIEIRVARGDDGQLVMEVLDDGAGASSRHDVGTGTRTGIGLGNTRARLQCLYGGEHGFEVGPRDNGGTRVWLSMPCRMSGAVA